jgi:4-amino-4-deoxy-L-arabinose transferase-like glycosyltransferase
MPFALAMLFWVSLAGGILTKGVPLFFVIVPMIILSLTTGTLPAQLRRWRSHLHVTGTRIGIASAVALIVVALASNVLQIAAVYNSRWSIVILGVIIVAMVLSPGLPGVLFRCLTGGNWGWWKGLRPFIGIPLLIALVAWWVIIAGQRTNWELIHQMVGVHFINRIAFLKPLLDLFNIHIADPSRPGGHDSMASYAQPPGFYLVTVWATFWPWSVLIVPGAFHSIRRVLGKTAIAIDPRPYQFLLAWIIPMWIILELSRGKLLHYPLPLYIPMGILCADALVQGWHRLTDAFAAPWFAWSRWGLLAIWIVLGIGTLVGAQLYLEAELFWRCVPLAGALIATGVAGAIAWNRPTWPFVMVLGWGATLLYANTVLVPEMPSLQLGKSAGQQMAAMKKAEPGLRLAAQGFEQPTLVFYAGQQIEMPYLNEKGEAVSLLDQIPFLPRAVPDARHDFLIAVDDKRLEYLRQRGDKYWLVGKASAVIFDKGKRGTASVYLIRNRPDPASAQPMTTQATTTQATTTTRPEVERQK